MKQHKSKLKSIIFAVIFVVLFGFLGFVNSDIIPSSSMGDRVWRLMEAWNFFLEINIQSFLFGRGVASISEAIGAGVASGLINVLIEKGFLMLCFLMYIINKYNPNNHLVLMYVIVFHLAFDFLWFPLFWLALAIMYASYFHRNRFIKADRKCYSFNPDLNLIKDSNFHASL